METLTDVPGYVLFAIGRTPITIGSLVAALALAAGGFLLARILGAAVRGLRGRNPAAGPSLYIVEKLTTYGLAIAGIVAAITMLGINLTSLAVFAGALGIGVGLGLQGVVKEFVSGLVLIFEGAVQVGDYIEIDGGGRGEVREIGARATRVRNNDNVEFLLPNARMIGERVTIWTHRGDARRIHVPFIVAPGSDKARVREVVLEAARAVPFTMPDTERRTSQVWLVEVTESSLKFELLVWPELSAVKRPGAMNAAYTWAISDALCAAGIAVPTPQIDVTLRQPAAPSPPAVAAAAAPNDAVEDLAAAKAEDIEEDAARDADVPL